MAYSTKGLKDIVRSGVGIWTLDTVDSLATAIGAGYITDATTTLLGKGVAGRGMALGDLVTIRSGVDNAQTPTTYTKVTPAYVSALNTTTGAGTLSVQQLS